MRHHVLARSAGGGGAPCSIHRAAVRTGSSNRSSTMRPHGQPAAAAPVDLSEGEAQISLHEQAALGGGAGTAPVDDVSGAAGGPDFDRVGGALVALRRATGGHRLSVRDRCDSRDAGHVRSAALSGPLRGCALAGVSRRGRRAKSTPPDTRNQTPDTRNQDHQTPGIRDQESDTRHQESETRNQTPGIRHQESDTRHQTPGIRNQTPDTRHQESETRNQTPDTRNQTPDTRNQEPGIRHQAPGIRHQTRIRYAYAF